MSLDEPPQLEPERLGEMRVERTGYLDVLNGPALLRAPDLSSTSGSSL